MKKSLSFVLVLALVLGSFSTAFAATTATTTAATKAVMAKVAPDVEGTAYEAPVTVLTALGVVSGYEDGNYKPANNVTRAEMAKLIIAELGLEANAQASKSSFKDMSGYGWADGYVGYAASLGIILGYGDGNFGPGNNVTHDEALTMIVRALGYTKDCKEMNGTWPAIYVQKARVLGITDDVKTGGAVAANRGDVAVYLYNTLTCNMGYADDKGVFQEKKDKDGDPIKVATTLDAAESKEYKVITNSDANNAIVNIRGFVGAYAKVFTLTKGKNDGDIIAISDVKSDFISGEYKAEDKILKAADGTEYTLDDVVTSVAGTSKELEKGYAAKEFVNGKIASATQQTILNANATALDTARKGRIVTIAADLSGKTVKGIYSVSIWNKISDEKVDADDIATIKNNKTLLGKKFIKDDNNDAIDVTAFELVGVKSLDDIKADHVVYVYSNSDDEITRVAVGTEIAEGEVTGIKEGSTSEDEEKVTIGGKTYLYASQKLASNGLVNDFNPGDVDTEDEVKVYLDAYGYMYDYDSISGKADNYAVVLEHGGVAGGIGSKREIKLFLADGTDKVFNVDNDLFKSGDLVPGVTIEGGWASSLTAGAIVKYGLDKDGMIESFEKIGYDGTAVKGYKMVTGTSNSAIDITEQGYYNNTQIRPNAVIFSFDKKASGASLEDRKDEDNYGVTTLEKVKKSKDVAATYVLDNNKIASMLLYDFSGGDEIYGVVTETAKKKVADADYMAKILVDGVEKEYGLASKTTYERARSLTKFDGLGLQKIEFNASGEVKGLKDAWKDSAAKSGDTYATASAVIATGTKATFNNNTFTTSESSINYHPINSAKTSAAKVPTSTIQIQNNAVVYKYDKGDFKVGDLGELKSLNVGAEVWFYDTKDDNNHGLMNIILIKNTDSGTTTDNTVVATEGTIAYAKTNITTGVSTIQIGTTTYTVTGVAQAAFDQFKNLFDVNGIPLAGSKVDVSLTTASNDNKAIVGFTNIVITVGTAGQFDDAEAVPGITQILVGTSNLTITQNNLINVNIGSTTGTDLTVATTATGSMTITGTGSLKNLTVNTPNATFTNNVAVTNTLTVIAVSANTMNQNAPVANLVWAATGAKLNLGSSATVTNATFNGTATVTGADKITNATANQNVTLDKSPANVTAATGVTVTVNGTATSAAAIALTAATNLVVTAEDLGALNTALAADLTTNTNRGAVQDAIVAATTKYNDAKTAVDALDPSADRTALETRYGAVLKAINVANVKLGAYTNEDALATALQLPSFTGYVGTNKAAYAAAASFKSVTTVASVNDAITAVNAAETAAADLAAAKAAVEGASYTTCVTADDAAAAKLKVEAVITALGLDASITATVTQTGFTAADPGDAAGEYKFTVALVKAGVTVTTTEIIAVIPQA